ncbi:MAG: type II toxin-antitoxin system RelE/ParE family toxin [Bacteroidales bacterium]|nr:type II toxin-antitoxin system RelE/ParE family toxin [Bacteroidales bacterium]
MKIVWSKKASEKLDIYLAYCRDNYGDHKVDEKVRKLEKLTNRLLSFPEMGFPEPILKDYPQLYRAYIFDKRLKIIYYIENQLTIKITDLWDSKCNPDKLKADFIKY